MNPTRTTTPWIITLNTGSVRFDLCKGPFTFDDSFIVSPFTDTFQYIPDVPFNYANVRPYPGSLHVFECPPANTNGLQQLQGRLNAGSVFKRDAAPRELETSDSNFSLLTFLSHRDTCRNPPRIQHSSYSKRSIPARRIVRRQSGSPNQTTPGYTKRDDFGSDGDDTIHAAIPYYSQPDYFQANASFPTDGTAPASVNVVFLDYFASSVVSDLKAVGYSQVNTASVQNYLPTSFTTNSYLPAYTKAAPARQLNVPNCPVT